MRNPWRCTVLLMAMMCHSSSSETLRNSLKGKHLRATIGHFPPSSVVERNSSGHVIGFSGDIFDEFDWLSKRLHFTYTMNAAKENSPGFLEKGSWHGMIGEIVRDEIDISLGPFALSLERYGVINFAAYVGGSGSTLMVKYPAPDISNWAVLGPFDLTIWMCWMASSVFVIISGSLFITVLNRWKQTYGVHSIGDLIIYILANVTCQGSYYRNGHRILGLIAAIWCFAAFVFVNAYSSILTSYLSAQYKSPDINSMEQLAENPTYQVVTMKGTFPESDLMNSKVQSFKIVADRWKKCSECRPALVDDVGARVLKGSNVALIPTVVAWGMVEKDYLENGQCHLTTASVQYSWQPMFYGVQKSCPFVEELNREALWALSWGIVRKWKLANSRCFPEYNKKGVAIERSTFPLKLQQLYAAFLILFVGYLIAFIQFIRENLTRVYGIECVN